METLQFTVDAALLQELGERLIGQPQIALAELIKNSYDADAKTCVVTFGKNRIEIADNGHGMSLDEFKRFWMRLGTTHKAILRQSRELKRPLTGSKGIGRLAAQFLARELELFTNTRSPSDMLYAIVDWGKIERGKDLATVDVEWEERKTEALYPDSSMSGTRLVLSGLKDAWDETRIGELGKQIWALRSPFRYRGVQSREADAQNFDVQIEAPGIAKAKESLDQTLTTLFKNWKARITGTLEHGRAEGQATLILEFARDYPEGLPAARITEHVQLPIKAASSKEPCLLDQVSFEIMIFKLEGRQPGAIPVGEVREYLQEFGNVSVYDSGFRIPYYGAKQDWLRIAIDQSRRISVSELLPERLRINERYMLDLPAPSRIFGHVDINTAHEAKRAPRSKAAPGSWLQLQAGRDRLHENKAYDQLVDLVRYSLDLYANRYRARELRRTELERSKEPASAKQHRALAVLDKHRPALPVVVYREVKREVKDALDASIKEEALQDRRAALLAPLAAAGMATLAFNHELEREERLIRRTVSQLRRLARENKDDALSKIAADLSSALDRRSTLKKLFAPLLSDEDRDTQSRLLILPIVQDTIEALEPIVPRMEFEIDNIPQNQMFPEGTLAEWSALIQNVVTNAWNATLTQPKPVLHFAGGREGRSREWLRISDNGQGLDVPLDRAYKLFEPFERHLKIAADQRSIAIGGQGLGLAIVKMIAVRRKASVEFVEPPPGFATCIELSWKG